MRLAQQAVCVATEAEESYNAQTKTAQLYTCVVAQKMQRPQEPENFSANAKVHVLGSGMDRIGC